MRNISCVAGLTLVVLVPACSVELGGERPGPPDPRDIARRAVATVDETWDNLGSGRLPNPLPIRRLMK